MTIYYITRETSDGTMTRTVEKSLQEAAKAANVTLPDEAATVLESSEHFAFHHEGTEYVVGKVSPATQGYGLLRQVNEEAGFVYEVENAPTPHEVKDEVKVPDSVRAAINDKLEELTTCLDHQKLYSDKQDYAVDVPGDEFPSPRRLRRSVDAAIGTLEWLKKTLDVENVEFAALRDIVIRLTTYGNAISQYFPAEVINFLYTTGQWRKFQRDEHAKTGVALPNSDDVTGFPNAD